MVTKCGNDLKILTNRMVGMGFDYKNNMDKKGKIITSEDYDSKTCYVCSKILCRHCALFFPEFPGEYPFCEECEETARVYLKDKKNPIKEIGLKTIKQIERKEKLIKFLKKLLRINK